MKRLALIPIFLASVAAAQPTAKPGAPAALFGAPTPIAPSVPPKAQMPAALPSAPPLATQATAPGAANEWRAEIADGNVRRVIERWARSAQQQVVYEVPKDVPLVASATFHGRYEDALDGLLRGIERSEVPLRVCLHANSVTRVVRRHERCD
jgi:hypothetical protein